ncbi:MAG: glycosyl transferase family 51 [Kiloniellaceae bacterium]|nr:glycosyl transferase family 51 [Kiloniellaceae bacterium]
MGKVFVEGDGPAASERVSHRARRGGPLGRGWRRLAAVGSAVLFLTAAGCLAVIEAKTSTLQAELFSHLAGQMTYRVDRGPSDAILFPEVGPFDRRLGYVGLPGFVETLGAQGYAIETQARISAPFDWYFKQSGIAPYRAKTQSGLTLVDRDGLPIFAARTPERSFESFAAVPPLIVNTLLFIENRELLDPAFPRANPAVEWDRLATAFADLVVKKALSGGQTPGGSTLATQMEKFRHSPEGRTGDVSDKLRQMISASLRGYLDGQNTKQARRQIVVDYLNSTPLAARAGFGEVLGLGDGLWAWFGTDFAAARACLTAAAEGPGLPCSATVYRQALSLLIAQRRPSQYLITGRDSLQRLVDSHLRLLAEAGIIDTALRDAALARPAQFTDSLQAAAAPPASALSWKASATLRARLLGKLGVASFYDLDRLDLTVETTLDRAAQESVTAALKRLADPESLAAMGLAEVRLLDRGAPEKVIYSLLLYERGEGRNFLRLQADNYDGPFDINEGTKLDLGSTAKLRTLVSYLEVVAGLYDRLRDQPGEVLRAQAAKGDALTRWAAGTLAAGGDQGLAALLEAAMQRTYSASPHERFFTGGGLHRFANFDKADNGKVMSVATALHNSVNLVFIRLMRDIVAYHVAEIVAAEGDPLDLSSPLRQGYLSRFAEREGREFMFGFYGRYRDLDAEQILAAVAERARGSRAAQAVVFRTLRPEADIDAFADFLRGGAPGSSLGDAELRRLFDSYAVERFPLNDRGYIAKVHPLELWLAAYLSQAPGSSFAEAAAAGAEARQEAYVWLFKPSQRKAQDRRIRTLLEAQAFARIAASWQRLGYPFGWLVPSYATAIGSSGDRPAALAELIGIIANEGQRLPIHRIERLKFAEGTPFETVMKLETAGGEAVLQPEVALALRQALVDTVERGTGRRANGAFHGADGQVLQAGGKTGTGDHRFERFGRGGQLLESTVVNRTATFVFFLGERFFGVISAHVAGPDAAAYGFTSALPTQLLRSLGPQLEPLLQRPPPATEPQLVADPPVPQDVEATLAAPAGDVCKATQRNAWRCTLPTVLQSAVRPDEGLAAQ